MSAALSFPSLVSLPSAQGASIVRLTIGDHSEDCAPADAMGRAGTLYALHGALPSFSYFAESEGESQAPVNVDAAPALPVREAPIAVSSSGERIHVLHTSLAAAGVTGLHKVASSAVGGTSEQIDKRARREREFLAQAPAREALDELTSTIVAERREDISVSARELGQAITMNGKVSAFGLSLSEHAMRGLCTRIESPAIRYLLGVRDRIAAEVARGEHADHGAIQADKAKIADVLQHECRRAGDLTLKLRTRKNPGDVFAIVSPTYAPADEPEVAREILPQLPPGARASFSYDPASTSWSLRLAVWTPMPAAEHAVGEPMSGFVQISGRDNGTASVEGSGGILVLSCLNGATYQADGQGMSRRHVGRILLDVSRMIRKSRASIDALCTAWGTAREATIEAPSGVTLEQAIPGFWRHLLTDCRSELVGVLPGRTETHVKELARTFDAERRDNSRLVRADMAHAWTRYAQGFVAPVQREAESAIGAWTVSGRVPAYQGDS